MPVVSIILLTHNRAALLASALASIAQQTFTSFEVVLVNDGSTDTTAEVIAEWQKRLPLKVITHPASAGITLSRNEAVQNCSGVFIAFLDDDDRWADPEKLSTQVTWFAENDSRVLLGGGMIMVDSLSKPIKKVFRPKTDESIRRTMLFRNNFFTSTVMVKTKTLRQAGGFVMRSGDFAEDYDLWLRVGCLGIMGNMGLIWAEYRQPIGSQALRMRRFLKKQLVLVRQHPRTYPFGLFAKLIIICRLLRTYVWKS